MLPVMNLERARGLVMAPKKPFCSSWLQEAWGRAQTAPHGTATIPCAGVWAWHGLALALLPCAMGGSGTQGLRGGMPCPRQSSALSIGPAAPPPAQRLLCKWHFD